MRKASLAISLLLPAVLGGCGPARPPADLAQRLQHEDPGVRAAAAIEAGQTGRADMSAFLVDRLDDSEETVRLVAILSLEKITGTQRGYRYFDPREQRLTAIQDWRSWLAARQATQPARASTQPAQASTQPARATAQAAQATTETKDGTHR